MGRLRHLRRSRRPDPRIDLPDRGDGPHRAEHYPDPDAAADTVDDLAERTRVAGEADTTLRAAVRLVTLHLRPVRMKMLTGLILLVLAAAVGLAQPLAVRYVLDVLAAAGDLGPAVWLLVGLIAAAAVSQGAGNFLMLRSAEDVVLSSRRRLIDRLLGLSVPAMRSQEPGDLMARVTSDTALIRQIALQSLVQFVTGAVLVVGAVVLMVLLDWVLFLVTFGVVCLVGIALGGVMPRIRRSARRTQDNVGAIGNELERVLGAFTTVKAAAAESDELRRLSDKVARAHRSGMRTAVWTSVAAMASTLAVQSAFLVVLGLGAYRVQSGALDVATLVAFLLYAMQLAQPVLQLTQAVSSFQVGRAALERIADVDTLEREAEPQEGTAPGSEGDLGPVSWSPAATLERVGLTYPGQPEPALRGVDLTVPGRGITAVVGPSGSGKSSILRLLMGFYGATDGVVRVAGRDLVEWDLERLRTAVAYVEQETPVFAGTLRANLTYGLDDVDDDDVRAALARVGLAERFASLDESEVQVGHRGSALSGGERQRIAIARALLRRPRLLLLDEATSQLDATNEATLRRTVEEIATGLAVVVVAHRLSTVTGADQIVVLEDGGVRAVGSHDELLAADELYRGLVTAQSATRDETVETAETDEPLPIAGS